MMHVGVGKRARDALAAVVRLRREVEVADNPTEGLPEVAEMLAVIREILRIAEESLPEEARATHRELFADNLRWSADYHKVMR